MWLIRIPSWLKQFFVAIGLALLAILAVAVGAEGFAGFFMATSSHQEQMALLELVIGICAAMGFGYLSVGGFLNAGRTLRATFRARFRWRQNLLTPLLVLLVTVTLSACNSKPELPRPTGAWEPLNGAKHPTNQNDISHAPPENGRIVQR